MKNLGDKQMLQLRNEPEWIPVAFLDCKSDLPTKLSLSIGYLLALFEFLLVLLYEVKGL